MHNLEVLLEQLSYAFWFLGNKTHQIVVLEHIYEILEF